MGSKQTNDRRWAQSARGSPWRRSVGIRNPTTLRLEKLPDEEDQSTFLTLGEGKIQCWHLAPRAGNSPSNWSRGEA